MMHKWQQFKKNSSATLLLVCQQILKQVMLAYDKKFAKSELFESFFYSIIRIRIDELGTNKFDVKKYLKNYIK